MLKELETLTFPQSASEEFITYVNGLKNNPYEDWRDIRYAVANKLIESLEHAATKEPTSDARRLLGILEESRNTQKLPIGVLVKNFPVDAKSDLLDPPKRQHYDPTDPQDVGKKTFVAEYAMLALNTAMGMDLAVSPTLQASWPYHHVTPKDGKENTASHAGTAIFPRHSDGAHLPKEKLVDWVGLHTVRNGVTQSILVRYDELETALKKELGKDFAILYQPRFIFSASAAYDGAQSIQASIIETKENGEKIWRVQGNKNLIRAANPSDKEAQNVLDKFLAVLENTPATHQFALEYGDVLFIDNLRGFVHTRAPIVVDNNPDDAKRHLLRTHGRFSADVINQVGASSDKRSSL